MIDLGTQPTTNSVEKKCVFVIVQSPKGINCYFRINFQNKMPVSSLLFHPLKPLRYHFETCYFISANNMVDSDDKIKSNLILNQLISQLALTLIDSQ